MAITTKSVLPPMELRGFSIGIVSCTFSGVYAAGGDPIVVNSSVFPGLLNQPDLMFFTPSTLYGYTLEYDPANKSCRINQQTGTAAPMLELADETAMPTGVDGVSIYALCVWFSKALSEDVI